MEGLLKRATTIESKLNKARVVRAGFADLNAKAGRRDTTVLTGVADGRAIEGGASTKDTSAIVPGELSLGLSSTWYTDMLEDNMQLKTTLSKFQSAIDLIMAKHRSQTSQLVHRVNTLQDEADAQIDAATKRSRDLEKELASIKGKNEEMLQVMSLAVSIDNEKAGNHSKELEQLRVENEGLRELLGIAGIPQPGYEDEEESNN